MSYYGYWKPKPSVAQMRAQAERQVRNSKGSFEPVQVAGNAIARSFWGKGWCSHLEKHSDFDNRLPRGRSYVRNGCVCHLHVKSGRIEARVNGSDLYSVAIDINLLSPAKWAALKQRCSGEIGSLLELLQGQLSDRVMSVVIDRNNGLFPNPGEMKFRCSCPDWALMCKHVAAVLYGVGNRLDTQPELLFLLRGADASELITAGLGSVVSLPATTANRIADDALSGIFGIELDHGPRVGPGEFTAQPVPSQKSKAVAPREKTKRTPVSKAKSAPAAPTAAAVARLRKRLGLTIDAFAARLNVSPASVSRWEAERGPLKLQARSLAALQRLQRRAK